MIKIWRGLAVVLVISTSLLLVSAFWVFATILDNEPNHRSNNDINSATARQVMQLSRSTKRQLSGDHENIKFVATEEQLNGLINIGKKADFKLDGQVNISNSGLYLALSKELPTTIFGKYLNINLLIIPSNNGLDLAYVKLGWFEVSGKLLLTLIEKMLNILLLDPALSGKFISEIQAVSFSGNTIIVDYHLTRQTKIAVKKLLKRLSSYQSELHPTTDSELIRQYYQVLIDTTNSSDPQHNAQSLARYIQPLFQLALERSSQSNATIQNRAALTALALYFTSSRVEYLVGDVITPTMKMHRRPPNVTLAERVDLQRHFVYSAAIELFSSAKIGDTIGELKELLDSNSGGSGFSFVDLLADRAGVQFTQRAIANEASARTVQRLITANFDERQLFPTINNLAEGISDIRFKREYQTVDDIPYQNVISDINKRLNALPIYQQNN